MKTLEELKARIAELARQYKEVRQMPVAKINQSPTATKFTVIEVSDFVAKLDSMKKLIASADKAVLTPALIAEFKEAISAFMLKFSTSSGSQQKQLVAVKGRAEATNVKLVSLSGESGMDFLLKPTIQTTINSYSILYNSLDKLKTRADSAIEAYITYTIGDHTIAYVNADNICKDELSKHKDQLKASADASAALWSVITTGIFSYISTSQVIFNTLVLKTNSKESETLSNIVNVSEDILQVGLDKTISTNIKINFPESMNSLTIMSPLERQIRLTQSFLKSWEKIQLNILFLKDRIIELQTMLNNFLIAKGETLSTSQFSKVQEQHYKVQTDVQNLINIVDKNMPPKKTVNLGIWRKNYTLFIWSKTIPAFKKMLTVKHSKIAVGNRYPETFETIEPQYSSLSWGLIEHWQSLGILSKSSCNKENIDFETFEWSWNDEIDLLIDWAKCYTLPPF